MRVFQHSLISNGLLPSATIIYSGGRQPISWDLPVDRKVELRRLQALVQSCLSYLNGKLSALTEAIWAHYPPGWPFFSKASTSVFFLLFQRCREATCLKALFWSMPAILSLPPWYGREWRAGREENARGMHHLYFHAYGWNHRPTVISPTDLCPPDTFTFPYCPLPCWSLYTAHILMTSVFCPHTFDPCTLLYMQMTPVNYPLPCIFITTSKASFTPGQFESRTKLQQFVTRNSELWQNTGHVCDTVISQWHPKRGAILTHDK